LPVVLFRAQSRPGRLGESTTEREVEGGRLGSVFRLAQPMNQGRVGSYPLGGGWSHLP